MSDAYDIDTFLSGQYLGANYSVLSSSMSATDDDALSAIEKLHGVQDKCRYADHDISEVRNMLVLYCQQFAFAPTMVPQCAALLTCKQRQLNYRLGFYGDKLPNLNHFEDHAH